MPVEWVQALLKAPEQAINAKSKKPFWAESFDKWPYLMQIVHPYITENWSSLLEVASKWTKQEPNTAEAWYYLAAAEYAANDMQKAQAHLQKVVAMNHQHAQAIYYLGLIAEKSGDHALALADVAMLDNLDEATANQLKLAMGTKQAQR
jgi:serine protease Do